MNQGMVGNAVTEWCHVTGNGISGWVDENYIAFTNVYRIQVSVGCNANVYAAESRSSSRRNRARWRLHRHPHTFPRWNGLHFDSVGESTDGTGDDRISRWQCGIVVQATGAFHRLNWTLSSCSSFLSLRCDPKRRDPYCISPFIITSLCF